MRGYLGEGHSWFERALAEAPARTAARAEALYYAGYVAWIKGVHSAARYRLEESVAIWRELGSRQGGLAHALWLLGLVMLALGEPAVARSLAEESVEIFRTTGGDEFGLCMSLAVLGIIEVNRGEHALALSLLEESAAISRKGGDDWVLSLPLRYSGAAAFQRGDYDRAVALTKESLLVLRESGEKWYISRSLECLAAMVSIRGDHGRGARLFGAGEALREAIGTSKVPSYLVAYYRGVAAARAGLDEADFAAAWAEGRAMTPEEAVEYALSEGEQAPTRTVQVPKEPSTGRQPDVLTRREEEVAVLVAWGLTNRQIAKELSISEHTAENHVRKILKKLGLGSRVQVAARAAEQGPIS
jgi:non-specific serine/threonine protein kinase